MPLIIRRAWCALTGHDPDPLEERCLSCGAPLVGGGES